MNHYLKEFLINANSGIRNTILDPFLAGTDLCLFSVIICIQSTKPWMRTEQVRLAMQLTIVAAKYTFS